MKKFLLLTFLYWASVLAIQAPDNKGTEFMILFLANYGGSESSIYVSAEQTTSFEVRAPAIGYFQTYTVNAGATLQVIFPGSSLELAGGIENKGINIKSLDPTKELTVIGFSRQPATTDAYVALPIDVLDTEHVLASYTAIAGRPSTAGVVAIEDNTQVTVYPSGSVNVGNSVINFPNSQTFTLNRYQTLYLTNSNGDVTGSRVVSNKAVAVLGGHYCGNVLVTDTYCDHLIEWIPPVNTWANEFFTVPLATRHAGDVIRIMTNEDGNQITIDGVVVSTINRYQFYQTIRTVSTRIQTSKPALVMQYSRGTSSDGVTSDPFQMWVPPFAQYGANYFITALNGFTNWINLVIESGKQSGLNLDGNPISTTWTAIPGTSYVSAQVQVSAGFHSIFHNSPIVPFGIYSYGWAPADSYGYPGGMRLAPLQDPCTETVTVAGDGIDNDCDQRVDEELRNGMDDDGDGRVDEDLASPPPQSCCEISQTEPFFTGSAPSTTIQCYQAVPAVPTISGTVDCPEPTTTVLTPNVFETQGNCADEKTITRRWIASDECGRSQSLVQTIAVVDTLPPSVVAPADKVVECGQTTFGDSATASDLCAGNVQAVLSDIVGGTSCSSSITRTWSAQDHCGNTGTDTQVINVVDTTPPSTTASDFCVFPPNGLYKCFDVSHPDYVFGSDVCNNDLTFTFNNDCTNTNTGDATGCVFNAGLSQVCVRATTDHESDTVYSFSFKVSDSCGNYVNQPVQVTVANTNEEVGSCVAPTTCIADCEDYQCPATTLQLFVDDVQVGILRIRNKLNWEVSFEFETFEGTIPDRGWWMTGLVISIGDKRVVKDFTFGNYQSRWFEALDAFPNRDVQCGADISIFVAVQVTNDKRNTNGVKHTVYPTTDIPLKRSFQLPTNTQDYEFSYTLCCECTMRTQTQNDFGNICHLQPQRTTENARVREIACYTDEFWTWSSSWCFPNGITVGCAAGNTATWTSPASLQGYLADETSPHVLAQDYVDPPRRTVGYLAAELAGLALNIQLDECDADWSSSCSHLRDLTVCQHPNSVHPECQPYWGSTIGQIFAQANSVVGGCTNGDVQQLFQCVRYINRAFVDGKRFWESPDFLAHSTCQTAN